VLIECNDLYYNHGFRRKHQLRKGERITWDIEDQSGKLSGKQFTHLMSTTFNARGMWGTYNTENFVDPRDARKKLQGEDKMITDDNGNQVKKSEWLEMLKHKLVDLVRSGLTQWKSGDLWNALMIENDGLRKIAGRYMKYELGVEKSQSGFGGSAYDLSAIEG
jgi:hypothetical protein